ncbi:MAG: tyrosine-type recombinase/integrase [Candidatus Pacearchaeota archaeon]|jgi:site-specific recombinase XerD
MKNQETINYIAKEMDIRNFTRATITSYLFHIESFLDFTQYPVEELSEIDVKNYLSYLYKKGKSESYTTTALAACKFLLYGFGKSINIEYSKKPVKIPLVLSQQELGNLINNIPHLKYRLIIELLYSSGLRLSEVINLKKEDLDFNEGIGYIRQGMEKKDRKFIISEKLLAKIHYYLLLNDNNKDSIYVFTGPYGRLSKRTIQQIIKRAAKSANITKRVHPHTLRHSFATHLLEQGTSLYIIQKLLGHNQVGNNESQFDISIQFLKNIPNPLDNLNLDSDIDLYKYNSSSRPA